MHDIRNIPSFSSTLPTSQQPKVIERSWSSLLASCPLTTLDPSIFNGKRVVMFGEQHQQAAVMKAQLLTLQALHTHAKNEDKRVVMVMEHFNFEQNELLRQFSKGEISDDDFIAEYGKSREGFPLRHYLPLLLLSRELDIQILGGFPPRPWASLVNKESLESLKTSDIFKIPESFSGSRWNQVSEISDQQVAYLRSMMSGKPPKLPDAKDVPKSGYLSGILPAQTLKDSFFAWSIDQQLVDPSVVVYSVCGLGHCEYGICATSKLENASRIETLIIASKSWHSTEYQTDHAVYEDIDRLADVIVPYSNAEENQTSLEDDKINQQF